MFHGLGAGTQIEVVINGSTESGQDVILDSFVVTTNDPAAVYEGMSWAVPTDGVNEIGSTQLVIIDGQRDENDVVSRRDGFLLFDLDEMSPGVHDYDIFYGNLTGNSHDVTVTQFYVTTAIADQDETDDFDYFPPGPDNDTDNDYEVTSYELRVDATNTPPGTMVAWRVAGSGSEFDNVAALGANFTIPAVGGAEYDIKVFYIDGNGEEVIVNWTRVTTVCTEAIGTILIEDPAAAD